MASYRLCLVVHDWLLEELAGVTGAEYAWGSFDRAVEDLDESGEDSVMWEMAGPEVCFRVKIERGEGYLFCWLDGEGPRFQAGKEVLWARYLKSGGNPEAARDPWYVSPWRS